TMLENKELFLEQTRKVVEYRNGLYSELFKIAGIKVKNTETNFLPFTVGKRSKQLYNFLSDNEIAVRDIGFHPILNNYLRVSISCEDDNKIFLKKVREFLLQ
ncbi:MAG: histidinol-phosphate aminotransferase family protein, partial [Candidatus Cloacimonetes bacterium]|nr:histidinol-phosphate aminotransferase family protein [Candidatus Cloacimonadota bacterium]